MAPTRVRVSYLNASVHRSVAVT